MKHMNSVTTFKIQEAHEEFFGFDGILNKAYSTETFSGGKCSLRELVESELSEEDHESFTAILDRLEVSILNSLKDYYIELYKKQK